MLPLSKLVRPYLPVRWHRGPSGQKISVPSPDILVFEIKKVTPTLSQLGTSEMLASLTVLKIELALARHQVLAA